MKEKRVCQLLSCKTLIVCPTRDRPDILRRTISSLCEDLARTAANRDRAVIVLDDSGKSSSRARNRLVLESIGKRCGISFQYHGPSEQEKILNLVARRANVPRRVFLRFFRLLGGSSWDLGGVRNYAVILGNISVRGQFIFIMIDDDIVIRPSRDRSGRFFSTIGRVESQIARKPNLIVGGVITGAPDESQLETAVRWSWEAICGHQIWKARHYRKPNAPYPISGGFFGFSRACSCLYPFPRWYNEDWTWMLRCEGRGYKVRADERIVLEQTINRQEVNRRAARREQEGEALFEGIYWAHQHYNRNYALRVSKSDSYWLDVVKEEQKYIDSLFNHVCQGIMRLDGTRGAIAAPGKLRRLVAFIGAVRAGVENMKTKMLRRKMQLYLKNVRVWRSLMAACRAKLAKEAVMSGVRVSGGKPFNLV